MIFIKLTPFASGAPVVKIEVLLESEVFCKVLEMRSSKLVSSDLCAATKTTHRILQRRTRFSVEPAIATDN